MKCLREGCLFEISPTRRKYCSQKCSLLEKSRMFRTKNPISVKQSYSRWRKSHRDSEIQRLREWYWANREHSLSYAKEYSHRDWDKTKALLKRSRAKRRARLQGVTRPETTLSRIEWESLIVAYDGRCAYCGNKSELTQDHIVPISKGGQHTMENIAPACHSCNSSKGTMDVVDFIIRLKEIATAPSWGHLPK